MHARELLKIAVQLQMWRHDQHSNSNTETKLAAAEELDAE